MKEGTTIDDGKVRYRPNNYYCTFPKCNKFSWKKGNMKRHVEYHKRLGAAALEIEIRKEPNSAYKRPRRQKPVKEEKKSDD